MPEPVRDNHISPYANARSIQRLDWFHPFEPFGTEQDTKDWIADQEGRQLYYYGRVEITDYLKRSKRVLNFCFRNRGRPTQGEQKSEMVPLPWGNDYEERQL